jgi:hypothetical protein
MKEVHDRVTLVGITLTSWSGEIHSAYDRPAELVRFEHGEPAYRVTPTSLFCRFEHSVELLDFDSDAYASIRTQHVVTFSLAKGEAPDDEAIGMWMDSNVYFMVYPYVREAIHAMSTRLDLPPVLLGVLSRDQATPSGVVVMNRESGIAGNSPPQ